MTLDRAITVRAAAMTPPLAADFTHPAWRVAMPLAIDHLWNGTPAPVELTTTARLLWTATDLWVGFDCGFTELDVDETPDAAVERVGLWDRDVCEIFVRSAHEPHGASYKEFEVAPTAQWCDLAIHQPRLDVDWRWQSGMRTAAAIDAAAACWRAVMQIPFAAFGGAPRPDQAWHANLFRIGRVERERRYLAWAATGTPAPDFHVPARFVPLVFAPAPVTR